MIAPKRPARDQQKALTQLQMRSTMKFLRFTTLPLSLCALTSLPAAAWSQVAPQASQAPQAWTDVSLSPQERAAALVHAMTLEEKASQMVNQSRAIPRLGIPGYDWWSEALHGVARPGVTEYPEPVGLAATFDPEAIHEMAHAIGVEGRIKHMQAMRAGHSNIFEGLDFWAPNINIFRDPRWGRGQETYGEDPFLTGRMGVAYVTGMQGDDPNHYLAISTPKHYAVHSGPESTRHRADVTVSKHDQVDTYLPAFRAAVTEGKADSVMCAYNSINGQPACTNDFLLKDRLRGHWNFNGYVVSDCGAVVDVFEGHHYVQSQPAAAADSVKAGMDNECVDFLKVENSNHDYKPYIDAVNQGLLPVADLDQAVERLYIARIKLGMFNPASADPYGNIDPSQLEGPEHQALAHRLADESMVLLKNNGVLPLKPGAKIAVVGPLAKETRVLLGNYNGEPTKWDSILDGMQKEFGTENITYAEGITYLDTHGVQVPASALSDLHVTYGFRKKGEGYMGGGAGNGMRQVDGGAVSSVDPTQMHPPAPQAGEELAAMNWTGKLTTDETGSYNLGADAAGGSRVRIDGQLIASSPGYGAPRLGPVQLTAGKTVALAVEYRLPLDQDNRTPSLELQWVKPEPGMHDKALQAARNADVVVAVVGITSQLEGEEMEVSEPGFKGGDRVSLALPAPEQAFVRDLAATGKPVVLVLTNGSALAINDESRAAAAVIDAFYPGEAGGAAVAETLSGKNNPSGRLAVTFYTGTDELPPFEDYSMANRTYRYFSGKPLYPFGYGLSYTRFSYGELKLGSKNIAAGQGLTADVTVTNTGKLAGDEVAQAYLKFPPTPGAPRVALRGFERVHLAPGESRTVHFDLKPRDLGMVTADGMPVVGAGEYTLSVGGGQPGFTEGVQNATFRVASQSPLPE
jgi:beta-glucosidase